MLGKLYLVLYLLQEVGIGDGLTILEVNVELAESLCWKPFPALLVDGCNDWLAKSGLNIVALVGQVIASEGS